MGMGAVYLGLLLYLWKRARDTEANLQETAEGLPTGGRSHASKDGAS